MKQRALDFLVCPACEKSLTLKIRREEGGEVMQGSVACPECVRVYPIVGGVPRFLDSGAYAASFGDQWNWFRSIQLDSQNGTSESERALQAASGWDDSSYAGRLLLDAGVGAGRYAEVAAGKGAEVVGVDLTDAVDAAFENVGRKANVHIVQADIFSLPFRRGTFDMAYSIGVLHHTPDTRAAFERVAAMVREGGQFAIYLYHGYGPAKNFSDAIRVITTRLPSRLMYVLATVAIPLYFLYRVPLLGKVMHTVFPISMHRDWRWRWLDTFDWYTPKYQWKHLYPEVYSWFRNQGFGDVRIFEEPIRMRGTRLAEKPAAESARSFEATAPVSRLRRAAVAIAELAGREVSGGV